MPSSSTSSSDALPARRIRTRGGPLRAAALVVTIVAIVKELRTPADQRTWHGLVGFVPYDFRMPTAARFREAVWSPDASSVISPTAFGVGWTLNVGRVIALLRRSRA